MTESKTKIEKWLHQHLGGSASISSMISLSGGACQDNYAVDLSVTSCQHAGEYELVLRTDKEGAIPGSLSRFQEYEILQAVVKAGVKTPKAFWMETQGNVIGHPFYFMDRISGKAGSRYITRDRELNKIRSEFSDQLADIMAHIHSITPSNAKFEFLQLPEKNNVAEMSVAILREQINSLKEFHPALDLGVNWMDHNKYESDSVVLIHGDFRTGNFLASPEGIQGIVDWEFAHWGDRNEDIAWLCVRDWRFGRNQFEAGGFDTRDNFYRAYEKASGLKVDAEKVRYWEVVGNLRWAIGSAQQAERHLSGKDKGIELAAIGRRTCEMEYEIMRLIENAG